MLYVSLHRETSGEWTSHLNEKSKTIDDTKNIYNSKKLLLNCKKVNREPFFFPYNINDFFSVFSYNFEIFVFEIFSRLAT